MKNTLALEELIKDRVNLEQIAKGYSEKLSTVTTERQALEVKEIQFS